MSTGRSQQGLALISALLIVSLAGVLGAARMFALQLETQASRALVGTTQARLVALGIEELAAEIMARDALDSETDHYGEPWFRGIREMSAGPMRIRGTIEDMQGRFNLNNLVTRQGTPDMIAVDQFRR
ncbi:MAG: type II secretion system protein GspK, partial [Gammaproteobacteria bacterium]|nr:type II secretion system protein GspK [Gammaproteobacteria bacterium]